jgi:hypothetical protein
MTRPQEGRQIKFALPRGSGLRSEATTRRVANGGLVFDAFYPERRSKIRLLWATDMSLLRSFSLLRRRQTDAVKSKQPNNPAELSFYHLVHPVYPLIKRFRAFSEPRTTRNTRTSNTQHRPRRWRLNKPWPVRPRALHEAGMGWAFGPQRRILNGTRLTPGAWRKGTSALPGPHATALRLGCYQGIIRNRNDYRFSKGG